MDLISRQAAMDGTKKIPDLSVYAYCSFLDMLSKLPSAEPKDYECWWCNCQKMKAQLSEEDATKGTTFDYIERQAAIDAMEESKTIYHDRKVIIGKMQDIVNNLPPVPEQQWIPVTERLPKYGKTVLITNDKGNVRSGRFRGVEFWKDDGDAYWTFKGNTVEHVVAWMPLPEPYKERTDETD